MHPSLKRAFVLVAICFVGLISATIWTVRVATSSHTPPVEKDYYEKGLRYEAAIAEQKKMIALGYDFQADWFSGTAPLKTGKQTLRLLLYRNGSSVTDAKVRIRVEKSATDAYNRQASFRSISPGVYEADLEVPFSGDWTATIFAETKDGQFERSRLLRAIQ